MDGPGPRNFASPRALAGIAALILAAAELLAFGLIGVGRKKDHFSDVVFFYAAGHAWLSRENPYQPAVLRAHGQGRLDGAIARLYYPPHCAPLFMALALFPYSAALFLFKLVNIAALSILSAVAVREVMNPASFPAGAERRAVPWFMAAILLGDPWAVSLVWQGQSSLLIAALLISGWALIHRNRPILGGVLLGCATIKPQFAFLPMVWLLCDRRWKVLAAAAATGLVLVAYPVIAFGPQATLGGWMGAIRLHGEEWCNQLGYRHLIGLPNLLFALGVPSVDLKLPAVAFTVFLWFQRKRFLPEDVLGILMAASLTLLVAHDYDVVVLAPLLASFWRHLSGRPREAIVALALAGILLVPDQIVERIPMRGVDQRCTVVTLVLLGWLLRLSLDRARVSAAPAAPNLTGGVTGPPA